MDKNVLVTNSKQGSQRKEKKIVNVKLLVKEARKNVPIFISFFYNRGCVPIFICGHNESNHLL